VPHPPGFPVRLGGVNELHAAFLIESRTRCHGWGRAVGNPGSFAHFAKGGIPRISIPTVAYPTLCKERKGWGTPPIRGASRRAKHQWQLNQDLFLISHPPALPTPGYETDFVAGQAELQIPPLRFAPVGMTILLVNGRYRAK
jgi:hypothetical protein